MAALTGAFGVQAQLNQGLLAHYDFNGNTNDVSGNGHHGVATGGQFADDRFGNPQSAFYFIPYSRVVATGLPTNYTNYTISAWVQMPTFFYCPDAGIVYQLGETPSLGSQHGAIGFHMAHQGFLYGIEHVRSDQSSVNLIHNVSSIDSLWHHMVATYDGSIVKYYKDNVLISSDTATSSVMKTDTLMMGYRHLNGFGINLTHWRGILDDVRIYDRPLSEMEIDSLYYNLVGLDELTPNSKVLLRILDLYGRETENRPNTPLIYVYSDGTTKKVFRVN